MANIITFITILCDIITWRQGIFRLGAPDGSFYFPQTYSDEKT